MGKCDGIVCKIFEHWKAIIIAVIVIGAGSFVAYQQFFAEDTQEISPTTKLDVISPTVRIIEPTSGETVKYDVYIKIEAKDNIGGSGVEKVEVSFKTDGYSRIFTAEPIREYNIYVYYWQSYYAPNGECEIIVKAYDYAGNVGEASITVIVKNQLII